MANSNKTIFLVRSKLLFHSLNCVRLTPIFLRFHLKYSKNLKILFKKEFITFILPTFLRGDKKYDKEKNN